MKEYYDIVNTISLHSPEHMTVNHDVTGSSPVGGAKRKQSSNSYSVFVYPIESNWARRRGIRQQYSVLLSPSGFDELL